MTEEEWNKEGRIRADTLYRAVIHLFLIPDHAIVAAIAQLEGRAGNDPVLGAAWQRLLRAFRFFYRNKTKKLSGAQP